MCVGGEGPNGDFRLVLDVVEPTMVKALAHPIRVAALALLEQEELSPKDVAERLDVTLPLASYHVRQLASFGLIELVRTSPRRGAVQHYYRATVQPRISDATWAEMPTTLKHRLVDATLRHANTAMAAGAAQGGFDRSDAHASRTSFRLDDRAWIELSGLLSDTLEQVERIEVEATARLDDSPDDRGRRATVLLMLFEGPDDATASTLV